MADMKIPVLCLALLGTTLTNLLAHDAGTKASGIRSEVLAKSTDSWDGSPLPPFPKEGQPEITVLRITVPPHTTLPIHEHPVYNAGYVTKGTLIVEMAGGKDDGKTLTLKAGDAIIEVSNKWHFGRNETDEPVEIVVVYFGPKGTPVTVLKDGKKADH